MLIGSQTRKKPQINKEATTIHGIWKKKKKACGTLSQLLHPVHVGLKWKHESLPSGTLLHFFLKSLIKWGLFKRTSLCSPMFSSLTESIFSLGRHYLLSELLRQYKQQARRRDSGPSTVSAWRTCLNRKRIYCDTLAEEIKVEGNQQRYTDKPCCLL